MYDGRRFNHPLVSWRGNGSQRVFLSIHSHSYLKRWRSRQPFWVMRGRLANSPAEDRKEYPQQHDPIQGFACQRNLVFGLHFILLIPWTICGGIVCSSFCVAPNRSWSHQWRRRWRRVERKISRECFLAGRSPGETVSLWFWRLVGQPWWARKHPSGLWLAHYRRINGRNKLYTLVSIIAQ